MTIGARNENRRTQKARPGADKVIRLASRAVPEATQKLLWGRAAGRCEFDGCNRPLWKSRVTQETRNVADVAHIYAFSPSGPRANTQVRENNQVHDVDNLLLVCHDCHVTIDRDGGPGRYSPDQLRAWKRTHEKRVEIATAVSPDKKSLIVAYGTHVGWQHARPSFSDAADALFPDRYPAEQDVIDLGAQTGLLSGVDRPEWATERARLAREFDRQVRIPLETGRYSHLSVFALAPQPLLIELGTLLGDITPADVYQRHREPSSWSWPTDYPANPLFQLKEPSVGGTRQPALVFSLSATVTPDRVEQALGPGVPIWTVTVPAPNNDLVKSKSLLSAFRAFMRPLLDRIKVTHGHSTPLHVFPAMPLSLAIEFGRIRMPNADSEWVLYDQQPQRGFIETFTIGTRVDV